MYLQIFVHQMIHAVSEDHSEQQCQIVLSIWYHQNLSNYVENQIQKKCGKIQSFVPACSKVSLSMGENSFFWFSTTKECSIVEIIPSYVLVSRSMPYIIRWDDAGFIQKYHTTIHWCDGFYKIQHASRKCKYFSKLMCSILLIILI